MLTKRAQILFDKKTYSSLEAIADHKGSSVGELVRTAVEKTYPSIAKKNPLSLAVALKDTFGAWKDNPLTDDELMNPLTGSWSEPTNFL